MIEIQNISCGYGKKMVLHDVVLQFPRGKCIGIIGPNGSGKSTLLKTIVGSITPSAGSILLDGKPLSELTRQERAKKIAYLSQEKSLADITVEQLVLHGRFPHTEYPHRYTQGDYRICETAMETMHIADYGDVPLSALSGGMRQNAYIAMALAQETEYIFLDEPTTFLDIENQLCTMEMLSALAENGKGIIMVLHDLPMALTFSDMIVVLQDGETAGVGTPDAICDSALLRKVFGIDVIKDKQDAIYRYAFEKGRNI